MGLTLPPWWGWENGLLENTQVIILSTGLVLSWSAARHNRADRKAHDLWLWLIPLWLLAIGRELSWGRVFYPVAFGVNGPKLISLHQLWYGPLVKPVIAAVMIAMIIGICRNSPLQYICQTTLPLFDIVILLITVIVASLCDKSMLPFFHPQKEILEEWAELTAYWSMVSIVTVTGFTKAAKFSLKQVKKISVIRRI
jgi:hypothetical protein